MKKLATKSNGVYLSPSPVLIVALLVYVRSIGIFVDPFEFPAIFLSIGMHRTV